MAATSVATLLASVWRHRWDRRMAGEGRRRRKRASDRPARAETRTADSR
ncbi:hypothetical protein [Yinghuangia seranimata]|nr:hypothetical protein [Yinghuangia seranimata]MDI2130553.1 hypothetical protein [Yinghuangia seranimata]